MDFAYKPSNERKPILHHGHCVMGICGEEAACQDYANDTYTCLCPHDTLPPTIHGKCPRNVVPLDPKTIVVINPQNNSTTSTIKPQVEFINKSAIPALRTRVANTETTFIYIATGISLVGLLLVLLLCLRRKCRNPKSVSSPLPLNLKQSLLVSERYCRNPQYSACTTASAAVPVLRRDTLHFINEIGEGCFGKVYKGELYTDFNNTPDIVAIKVLKESATAEAEEDFLREVEIMSTFKHSNILSLLGVVLREASAMPMMVFEYMPHGDLTEVLRAQQKRYSNSSEDSGCPKPVFVAADLLSIAWQIASGMQYLAAQRFVHRDLACRNCLVTTGPTVKIADFGMSRDVYTCDYYKIGGTRLLPVRWMSPDSIQYGRFTLESDIWSYGVVLWEIYSFGRQPYYGHTNEEVVKLILDDIMLLAPENCPSHICVLMQMCWKTKPHERIRFDEICEHLAKEKVSSDVHQDYNIMEEDQRIPSVFMDSMKRSFSSKVNTIPKQLPRPPPLSSDLPTVDILDSEGYLLPKKLDPVAYLETIGPYD